jgi:pimeloyl-ACP methyl ester carboxylesterase
MNDILRDIPPEGHLASVNGIDMYYELHGEGSPLILLHGFSRCSQAWRSHIGRLAKHYRTIPIDFRGHGWSTNLANEFTHRQCALDIFALMDQLDIDQFKAIGHSSGGMILRAVPQKLDSALV